MPTTSEPTPCGVMFDVLKRRGRIKHGELASMILSGRPLSDGRSPASRAQDRTWVSRFLVHAPVSAVQPRYFCDFGVAALRVANRLRSRRLRMMSDAEIIEMVCGEEGRAMDAALIACHQDGHLYRNALDRLARSEGHTEGEIAEAVLVLFISAGCSANARLAVDYTLGCARVAYEMHTSTPSAVRTGERADEAEREARPLGLLRVEDGYAVGEPYWVAPAVGAVIGALAMGEGDITDVAPDVSAEHARLAFSERAHAWQVEDLGSRNGTVLVGGASGERRRLEPGCPVSLAAGDELRLATATTFIVIC